MNDCVCCSQGCPKDGAVAHEGDRWCQQCQKDGCPQPRLVPGPKELKRLMEEYEKAVRMRQDAEVKERLAWRALRDAQMKADDRNQSLRSGSPV